MRMGFIGLLAALSVGCTITSTDGPDDSLVQLPSKCPLCVLHASQYSVAAFSPDGLCLALGGPESVAIWDLGTGAIASKFPNFRDLRHIAFSPDGTRFSCANKSPDLVSAGNLDLWEFKNGNELNRIAELWPKSSGWTEANSFCASFSPDGKLLAGGNGNKSISIWDAATGRQIREFASAQAAAFSPDGKTIITVSPDGEIRHWDAADGRTVDPQPTPRRTDYIFAREIAFAPVGNRVAIRDDYSVSVKDLATGKQLFRLAFPRGTKFIGSAGVESVAISPDGRLVVVSERATGVHFIDATTGVERGWWNANGVVAFSADGTRIVWREKDDVVVRDLDNVLANLKPSPVPELSDPPGIPLQLELMSKKSEYVLDLKDKTAEELAARGWPAPDVDMELVIQNVGVATVSISSARESSPGWPEFVLLGDGAINSRSGGQATARSDPRPAPIVLQPGQAHRVPITHLYTNHFLWGGNSFWLLPGKYTLYASYQISLAPAANAAAKAGDSQEVTLWSRPIQVKVIAPR